MNSKPCGILRKAASFALLTLFFSAAASVVSAQELPDSIFDNCPAAFGNTLLDVPPDISEVKVELPAAGSGKPAIVRAVVKTDEVMSIFRVTEASVIYEAEGVKRTRVPMKLVDKNKWIWQAEIPARKSGVEVKYGIVARDGAGNAVAQLINSGAGDSAKLVDVIRDGEDSDIEGSVDITEIGFSFDGEKLSLCETFRMPYKWSTFRGAAAAALGFYPNDVRMIPSHSVTENVHSFIAYVPMLGVEGVVNIEGFIGGGGPKAPAPVKAKGNRVCARAKVSDMTSHPERGLKVYGATAVYNAPTGEFGLGDATPYAILYFGGGSFVFP